MTEQEELDYEMPEEIDFSKGTVIRNPFPARARARAASQAASEAAGRRVILVALDSDVAEVYDTDHAVNDALRRLMKAQAPEAAPVELAKAS